MSIKQDRNFDTLIHRFDRVVYDSNKGSWRLRLLKEDLQFLYDSPQPIAVWDAGCGFGQISHWLAGHGHRLVMCDVSSQMLMRARAQFQHSGLSAELYHASAQSLAPQLPTFDLVLFHAVLEWLVEPLPTLSIVAAKVKSGGYLSLMFYNRNAVVFKNALRGGWRMQQLLDDSYMGKGNHLTPPNPQYPGEVCAHLDKLGFDVMQHTGIRVFHDYLPDENYSVDEVNQLFDLEARYCRMPTFRDMGRYIHVLARRTVQCPPDKDKQGKSIIDA